MPTMTPERWQHIKHVFYEALQREPAARKTFLAEVCRDDGELQNEVEQLLEHSDQADAEEFFVKPAFAPGTESVDSQSTMTAQAADAAPSPQSTSQPLPKQLGQYEVVKLLGKGGMGAVYLAVDPQLERQVAIKVPAVNEADPTRVFERFRREAKAIAAIQHPNICPVHEVGEADGVPFMAMAYIEGKPLSRFIKSDNPLPIRAVVTTVRKLARAMDVAHNKGVIHRDLKPSNIMINELKEPVIMDFGLARREGKADPQLTQTGQVMGTPHYIAPEQITAGIEASGPSCDIYSLGVIFYQLLTGRVPFEGDLFSVLSQIAMEDPTPPSAHRGEIDGELTGICLQAMARQVEHRFATMGEFANALGDYLKTRNATRVEHLPVGDTDPRALQTVAPPPITIPSQPSGASPFAPSSDRKPFIPSGQPAQVPPPSSPPDPSIGPSHTTANRRRRKPAVVVVVLSATLILVVGIFFVIKLPRDQPVSSQDPAEEPPPLALDAQRFLTDASLSRVDELLAKEEVRTELDISADQGEELDRLLARGEDRGTVSVEFIDTPADDAVAYLEANRSEVDVLSLVNLLDGEQVQRLAEIALQWRGPRALLNEQIAALLQLSTEQQIRIQERITMEEQESRRLRSELQARGHDRALRHQLSRLPLDTDNALLAFLTEEQVRLFESMKGRPFGNRRALGRITNAETPPFDVKGFLLEPSFRIDQLLSSEEVRTELGNIADLQTERLDEELSLLAEEHDKTIRQAFSAEDRRAAMNAVRQELEAVLIRRKLSIVNVLHDDQASRLAEIILQWKGPRALTNDRLAAHLQLSSEQRQKIEKHTNREQAQQAQEQTDAELLAVLTELQREDLDSLKGPPFDTSILRLQRPTTGRRPRWR